MPYIDKKYRNELKTRFPLSSGELNYSITLKLMEYLECHGHSYKTFNDVLGALEGAKLEFYRRVVAPYETTKLSSNGDVYLTET